MSPTFATVSTTFTPGALALVSFPLLLVSGFFFFFQRSVSIECHCMFFFWSFYIPSNVSELLQCFLPCIWLFLLLFPKAFGKFLVFQWFWRSGNLFPSSSLQSRSGHFIAALQSFTLSSVSCCNLWGLSAGRSFCLRFWQPCKWSPWVCWHVNCPVLCKRGAPSIIFDY